jgi:hypothetical protein
MNEVDAGRGRATPASVRHDDDEPLTRISPCRRRRRRRRRRGSHGLWDRFSSIA